MKARALIRGLTLRHPWPVAIAWFHKDVENRTWPPSIPPGSFLALCGGTTPVQQYASDFTLEVQFLCRRLTGGGRTLCPAFTESWTEEEREHARTLLAAAPEAWISQGIVAVAQLGEPTRTSTSPWAASDQYYWPLLEAVRLPTAVPPGPGFKQKLRTLDDPTLQRVRQAYRASLGQAA